MTAEEPGLSGRERHGDKLLLLPKGEEATKEITLTRDTIIVPILETEEKNPAAYF